MISSAHPRRVPSAPEATPIDSAPDRTDQKAAVIPLRQPKPGIGQLSGRELQVLELTAEGLTNAEIAKKLFLSEETIKTYQRKGLSKLQARSRAHAVALGFRQRLIT